ncbi:heterokaryon incompatibility protein-domain-containing protein [Pestalotiopsis sp. NC0098]|nr:heterokaryon incompatibility protein-domain-containing protein [Pestalotiopsis sp. NC0098]
MHLINTATLELEYFIAGCPLPYAILSHTWDTDEVTFADLSGKRPEEYEKKAGFDKIRRTCLQAKEDGLQYAWVDTCCINKDSSAELSEAINSMYKWYEKAAICYAYISDSQEPHHTLQFPNSRWFSRGWTLQELLAPKEVVFYGEEWTLIGTKGTMLETLEQITGVPAEILSATKALDTVSVAARMSWAACRETTRVEDMAYCLLGIFDVNMPLLYGEGSKAFLRLQSEIMSQTQDDSLFAWCADQESATRFPYHRSSAGVQAEVGHNGRLSRVQPVKFILSHKPVS